MTSSGSSKQQNVCPSHTPGKRPAPRLWSWWLILFSGLAALVWFLVRVLPKPARAAYPCQRAAAPLAAGFVLWLGSGIGSAWAYRQAGRLLKQSRARLAFGCLSIAAVLAVIAIQHTPTPPAAAAPPVPNQPIGQAQGLHPGRVVWAHDPDATDWAGPGNGHWWEPAHTSQTRVDQMLSRTLRTLAGQTTDAAAWNALIRHFNQTRRQIAAGYTPGEKIAIKVNLVGCIHANGWGGVDPNTYNLVSKVDYMNTSPQVMLALLRQLVTAAGVNPADISIGDPVCLFPKQYYDLLHPEFPQVQYLDYLGGNSANPRTKVLPSDVRFYWSARPTGKTPDYIPAPYAQATYFINLANFKSHSSAGVTLCGKNYYGFLARTPVESGYYDMHLTLPELAGGPGQYRCMVDLMGHAHSGGKALLYLVDGLYSGVHPTEDSPRKWLKPPFNNDWTSSLFASQDPVAIDSVGFDFLYNEWILYTHMSAADDYLHEAAQADNPPSGKFYDPNHATATTRLASLGVHEHWNNATDRQYSRNLGTGEGIEFVVAGRPTAIIEATPTAGRAPLSVQFDGSDSYDVDGAITEWSWDFENDGVPDEIGQTITHVYATSGDHTAALSVTDNEGNTDTRTVLIAIDHQPGDGDSDYDVDQSDFGRLQACMTTASQSVSDACRIFDLNGDGFVNQPDVTIFRGCMSGPNSEGERDCAD